MLGLGWTEMLVIGVIALIVIGPKDLPVVMSRIGKVAGQIRRMGSDFQREINKSTGLDEVRNLRNSITAPLKKTSDEIRKEFNAMTPTGPKPSGIIKPADPKAESVVDEIKAAAGMTPPKTADQVAAEAGFKPARPAPVAPKVAAAPAKAAPAKKAPVKAKAAPTRPVVTTELPPIEAKPQVKKPAAAKKAAAPAKPTAAPKPAKAAAPVAPKKRVAKPVAEGAKAGDA
jgi:sec-independent protein translocase protein TatB